MRIIDLSQVIENDMEVYPGHQKTKIWEHHTHEETFKKLGTGFSYSTLGFTMSDHGGTHVDAFNHLSSSPEALSIDKIQLSNFITRGICLDVSIAKPNQYIDKEMIINACRKSGITILQGDTVLLYTGHYNRTFGTENWMKSYPGLNREATEYLAISGAINIGVDTPGIDNPVDKTYPAHTVCKERNVMNTESMANLDKVVGEIFKYIGLPLKIKNGTGSPIRAVAILED